MFFLYIGGAIVINIERIQFFSVALVFKQGLPLSCNLNLGREAQIAIVAIHVHVLPYIM